MQTEQLLCWGGVTDTEHSSTSGSNEEEDVVVVNTTNSKSVQSATMLQVTQKSNLFSLHYYVTVCN